MIIDKAGIQSTIGRLGAGASLSEGAGPAGAQAPLEQPPAANGADRPELSPEELQQVVDVVQEAAQLFNERLSFVLHEESGRMQVQVVDQVTQEVVREIPPTDMLDAVARIRQALGLLLDEAA